MKRCGGDWRAARGQSFRDQQLAGKNRRRRGGRFRGVSVVICAAVAKTATAAFGLVKRLVVCKPQTPLVAQRARLFVGVEEELRRKL